MRYILFVYSLLLFAHASSSTAHELTLETIPGRGCWVDPRVNQNRLENFRVTVWFEQQLLGDGLAYQRWMASLHDTGRRDLRVDVRNVLKAASQLAVEKAGPALNALKASDVIQDVTYHWIVNGFTCTTDKNGVEAIQQIPGVRCLFFVGPVRKRNTLIIKDVQPEHEDEPVPFQSDDVSPAWYIKALRADKAWSLYNATGAGVLNVIHDGNFVVSPTILSTRYRNQQEQANGLDDDGNGLIDDLHGFDFDRETGDLLRRGSYDINTIDRNLNNQDDWMFFEQAFNNADKDFLRKVKKTHPELTNNDLRLCAYLRLNLSSKEIAPLLNISLSSVEIKRYRLRKKMNLSRNQGLTDHILSL